MPKPRQPRTRAFDVRDLPSMPQPRVPAADDFAWDPLHGQRTGKLPDGDGFYLRLIENCILVVTVVLSPVCKIGKLPARGDLFDHMRDRDRPDDFGPDLAATVAPPH